MLKIVTDDADRDDFAATLDELVAEGARRLLVAGLEVEVANYIERHESLVDEAGHRLVVRNGRAEERSLMTGAGALKVQAPRVDGRREGTWRIARRVAKDRVISTVDPETRHMHKSRSSYRDGYKAHIAIEPETGIITACALTPANIGDGPIGVDLLYGEPSSLTVLADSAYGAGPTLADLAEAEHTAVIKPWPLARNSKLGDDQYTRDDFTIDYDERTVTCPNAEAVAINAGGQARFGARCRDCPVRERCTTAVVGRVFGVGDHDQLLAQARTRWRDGDDLDEYRQNRPMVERSIAWIVTNGHRRIKYRGVERNRIAPTTRAAVINLRRLINLGLVWNPDGWAFHPG